MPVETSLEYRKEGKAAAVRREADRRLFAAFCGPVFENGHQPETRGNGYKPIKKLSQNNLLAQPSVFAVATTGQAALAPRFKSSTDVRVCVSKIYPPLEDPVRKRGGLKLGSAFLSRWILAGDFEPKSLF
jgi:hypothetical protein